MAKRITAIIAAIVILAAGITVSTAPQAGAFVYLSSWKWNTRNIAVEDIDGRRTTMEPGTYAENRRKQKRVYIPSGCRGYWSTSTTRGSWLTGGRWNTLSAYRQIFGGKIYLQVPPGVPNRRQCNRA